MSVPTLTISENIPEHLRAEIEEVAMWKGMSVSDFITDAAAKEAQHLIEKERLIQLCRDDAERILSPLDSPPPPNAALRKVAERHERLLDG